MDTGTHFAFGFGLAGLSRIDPAVSSDPWTAAAVLFGTVLGSQAPDFDALIKLKSNADYVRRHRGLSHSIPAWFGWTAVITLTLCVLFPLASVETVLLWVFVAVAVHVATDLFNAYGTQAFRPFTSRWFRWNIIHIFDPFLFVSHLAAVALWLLGASPAVVFPSLYLAVALYFGWRTLRHYLAERSLPRIDPTHRRGDRYSALPTIRNGVWNVVKRSPSGTFAVGELRRGRLTWLTELEPDRHPAAEASKAHPDVRFFLAFTPYACPKVEVHPDGYTVRWIDVRYAYRKQFPFQAAVRMDERFRIVASYIGWISDRKLNRRMGEFRPDAVRE